VRTAWLGALTVAACVPSRVTVVGAAGRIVAWDGIDPSREEATFVSIGAGDLSCEPVGTKARRASGDGSVIVVEGCGRRTAYLLVMDEGEARRVPAHAGAVEAATFTLVRLSGDSSAARDGATRFLQAIDLPDPRYHALDRIDRYFALMDQGARDLTCRRQEVIPTFQGGPRALRIPVAEGCGQRATYLPDDGSGGFRLSAIVPMAKSELRPFE
jgi:hypothetical protein